MQNYWLIPMDFDTCNYERLRDEWNKNKKIMWQVPGNPKLKNGKWVVANSMAQSLKRGDVIYFYVSNLPSESRDGLSRIMLRGIIEDEPYAIEKDKVYMKSEDTTMVIGFSIGAITTLCKEQLENNLFLSYEYLKKNDPQFKNPQGKNWPDKTIKKSLSEDTIELLETSFKISMQKNDFEVLINHFKKKCFFCERYGTRNEHKTFIGKNGLDYFEYHHFVPQYKKKSNPELEDIIETSTNGLFLCANCHRKIHYGRVEDVNEMLKIVLQDSKIIKMLEDFNFQKNIGEDNDIFKWFKDAYK